MKLLTVWAALPLLAVSLKAQSGSCAATPEAAAAGAFTSAPTLLSYATRSGYRVQDVQVDVLTRHVWVRVRRCDSDAAPALLIPMQVSLGSPVAAGREALHDGATLSAAAMAMAPVTAWSAFPVPAPARVIAVYVGDDVRVVVNGLSMHMEMEGRALEEAAVGDVIDVALHRALDEPDHRLRGRLRANHTVEVQP